jgi:hypothetical protein
VFASSRRTDVFRRINNWRRSYISRIPGKNFGHFRESHSEQSLEDVHDVQWSNHTKDEATWEKEEKLKAEFLDIFLICLNLGGEIHPKGGRFVRP